MASINGHSVTSGGRNGLPPSRPYIYRGNGESLRDAEIQERLRLLRTRIATAENAPLPDSLMAPPEVHREREEADVRALLATSREARAAVPTPTVISLRAVVDPIAPAGHRRAWYTPRPVPVPAPAAQPAKRCRRCGYLASRCGGHKRGTR